MAAEPFSISVVVDKCFRVLEMIGVTAGLSLAAEKTNGEASGLVVAAAFSAMIGWYVLDTLSSWVVDPWVFPIMRRPGYAKWVLRALTFFVWWGLGALINHAVIGVVEVLQQTLFAK